MPGPVNAEPLRFVGNYPQGSVGKHGVKKSEVTWKKGKSESIYLKKNTWKSLIMNHSTHGSKANKIQA